MRPPSTRTPSRSRMSSTAGPGSTRSVSAAWTESSEAVTTAIPACAPSVTSIRARPSESVTALSRTWALRPRTLTTRPETGRPQLKRLVRDRVAERITYRYLDRDRPLRRGTHLQPGRPHVGDHWSARAHRELHRGSTGKRRAGTGDDFEMVVRPLPAGRESEDGEPAVVRDRLHVAPRSAGDPRAAV